MAPVDNLLQLAKALGEETRLRALLLLEQGELCLCDIVDVLGKATSTMSRHMAELVAAGLVASRREGKWTHYRQIRRGAAPDAREALRWARRSTAGDPLVERDAKRVAAILAEKRSCGS